MSRQGQDDVGGSVQEELIYHVKKNCANEARSPLKKLTWRILKEFLKNIGKVIKKVRIFIV